MMDIINEFGYNITPNPHVNLSDLGKIIPESYRIAKSKIPSFKTLTPNEIKLLFPLIQTELSTDHFKPH
jgi:hypothetical protein